MNKDRKAMYVSLIALAIAVVGVSIAYAALSTSLKIKFGAVTQSAITWDVRLNKGTSVGIVSGTNETTCGNATVTESSVTLDNVGLSKPGDQCTYPLTVQNKGDIDANLQSITATSPTGIACESSTEGKLVCGNVVYKLTSDVSGSNILQPGNQRILKNNGANDFYLVVSYEVAPNTVNEASSQSGAGFTVVYGQDNYRK